MSTLKLTWICTLLSSMTATGAKCKRVINVIGLFPISGNISENSIGLGVQPAVEIALDLVNKDENILRNFELKMHINDTQCDVAIATKIFFDIMSGGSDNAMLFGDACWEVTGPLAQISKWWNMTMLSYADTNPILSNRKTYSNFYRTVPSDSDFNPARLALLQHFNWRKVGTIYQDVSKSSDSSRFSYAHDKLQKLLLKHGMEVTSQSFSDNPSMALRNLKDKDIRIILGNFSPRMAIQVFCMAFHLNMYGPKYQWIILGGFPAEWWVTQDEAINCTVNELKTTMEGYIATDIHPLTTNPEVTDCGLTPLEYLDLYRAKRKNAYSKYHGYAFDGVWVMARALDRALSDRSSVTKLSETFDGTSLSEQLNVTNFKGVTGKVMFKDGDRLGEIMIEQFQDGEMVKIGEYKGPNSFTLFYDTLYWRSADNKPPIDRNLQFNQMLRVGAVTYSVLTILSALGIVMAICFLIVNIYFRQHRYIKMSSPNMNNLIIAGCLLTYISVILLGSDGNVVAAENFHHMCSARSWVISVGFTLAFGAMFGKTWRVHAIFTNIKLNKKVIKDYKLFMIVGVLLLIDAIILTLWQTIDPLARDTRQLQSKIINELEEIPILEFCSCKYMTIWLVIVYVYKGLLLVIGCFFAWETRHVSIPALNDSKYIGMSVYNVVILCLCGAAVSFIVYDQPNSAFIIIGLFIIFCSTITLCLVFVPKVIELKRDPKGEEKRVRATLSKTTLKHSDMSHDSLSHKIKLLVDENSNYRSILNKRTKEIRELLNQLGDDVGASDNLLKSPVNRAVLALRKSENARLSSPSKTSRVLDDDETNSLLSEVSSTWLSMGESPTHVRLKAYMKARSQGNDISSVNVEPQDIRNLSVLPSKSDSNAIDKFALYGGVYLGSSNDIVEPGNDVMSAVVHNQNGGLTDIELSGEIVYSQAVINSNFLPVLRETEDENDFEDHSQNENQMFYSNINPTSGKEIMIIGDMFSAYKTELNQTPGDKPSFIKQRKIQPRIHKLTHKKDLMCDVIEYI